MNTKPYFVTNDNYCSHRHALDEDGTLTHGLDGCGKKLDSTSKGKRLRKTRPGAFHIGGIEPDRKLFRHDEVLALED
jgi:hypothetical protein